MHLHPKGLVLGMGKVIGKQLGCNPKAEFGLPKTILGTSLNTSRHFRG